MDKKYQTKFYQKQSPPRSGSITLLVVIFAGIMVMIFGGTVGFIFTQHRLQNKKADLSSALQISEAGLDYYKWFLSHYPDDLQDGTGAPGPYEHEYSDPEGAPIGKFSLAISGNSVCDSVSSIDIASTGWTYSSPDLKRTIKARYSRPSVAEYAYIIDDNVWAGGDRVIKGKYHSNGGIRMDGENDSLVTSAKETWNCTPSFGCASPYEVKPGVFGAGSGSELWKFPSELIDFTGLTLDFAKMKYAAQNSGGIYFPPPSEIGYPNGRGYHVIFKSDGTFDVYVVTRLGRVYSYSSEEGWHWSYEVISRENFYNNYTIPSGCGLIFVEDDLWVEGEVKGKVTVASADLINPNVDTNVWLNGNITYTTTDGSDGLLVLGENNVRIPLYSPDQMSLRGIFMAQKGHFGRNLYTCWYSPNDKRTSLKINGSIVSKGRVGTKWSYWYWGCGYNWSGYDQRENSYDRKLMSAPPPMTPFTSDEYKFIDWNEKQ